jgi:CheY-like chemotaxis protein
MILIVDDFEPQRYMRRRQLEAAGFTVCDAATTAAAKNIIASGGVAVVVSDIGLKDGNGIALCAEIKRGRPDLPVVLLSATYRTEDVRRDAMAAGADAVLAEPLPADQLVRIVKHVRAGKTSEREH